LRLFGKTKGASDLALTGGCPGCTGRWPTPGEPSAQPPRAERTVQRPQTAQRGGSHWRGCSVARCTLFGRRTTGAAPACRSRTSATPGGPHSTWTELLTALARGGMRSCSKKRRQARPRRRPRNVPPPRRAPWTRRADTALRACRV